MRELHARAMGKAVLANLNESQLSAVLASIQLNRLTPNTLVEKKELLADLDLTRKRGYSINNEEYVNGLICIGAPLINYNSEQVVGAVSLDFPVSDFDLHTIERNYTGILTKLASELSAIFTSADS